MSGPSSDEIKPEDIHNLLEHCVKTAHKVKDGDIEGEFIMERCLVLFSKDYRYSVIKNFSGELCGHYPSKVVFLEYQLSEDERNNKKRYDDVQSMYDIPRMRELIKQARYARCRSRFAVPVILYEGKHICRSATLASGAEMFGRTGLDFLFSAPDRPQEEAADRGGGTGADTFDRFRGHDINLLKTMSIKYICDLMVEKKKVKFGMNITSSEKVDKENRYADFCILSIPYPGCEFFKEWKDNSYFGETMKFDWSQDYVDANLDVPDDSLLNKIGLDWKKYRTWDLIQLTQNYMKLFIHILREGDTGILVHCISGWDRTPMFISLLRLSLWADGVAHATLSPSEILYLTLAYDWYLFGHNLPDRVNKGEEILFFCFNFLTYITSEEFSVKSPSNLRKVSRTDSECNMDGVLLDTDHRRFSIRGSNTSISSLGSCSFENAPVFFSTNPEDDSHLSNGNPSVSISARYSPAASRLSMETTTLHGSVHSNSSSSSSPMAVPNSLRKVDTTRASSPGCGSWQVVSSCGSLRGLVSSHDSPHSVGSSGSSGRLSSCQEAIEYVESTRHKKLDAVRRIFHNAYVNKIATKSGGAGGIVNFLDQFAEKVGIRSGRTTVV
ncbi:myotubularin-related protein 14-like [Saccostrea cucullata]|uniref:myotubularin-related protein 14-like n=1 Tax=Saccostrea cuccullata TaxID=36930 RepID=UPI002ED11530